MTRTITHWQEWYWLPLPSDMWLWFIGLGYFWAFHIMLFLTFVFMVIWLVVVNIWIIFFGYNQYFWILVFCYYGYGVLSTQDYIMMLGFHYYFDMCLCFSCLILWCFSNIYGNQSKHVNIFLAIVLAWFFAHLESDWSHS